MIKTTKIIRKHRGQNADVGLEAQYLMPPNRHFRGLFRHRRCVAIVIYNN